MHSSDHKAYAEIVLTGPQKPCRTCGAPSGDGYCDRHQKHKRKQYGRLSPSKRGYDHQHNNCRELMLRLYPMCQDCLAKGKSRAATDLHHIQKICDRPDLRFDPDNLMCLCKECHDVRSARGE